MKTSSDSTTTLTLAKRNTAATCMAAAMLAISALSAIGADTPKAAPGTPTDSSHAIQPFRVGVPDSALADLRCPQHGDTGAAGVPQPAGDSLESVSIRPQAGVRSPQSAGDAGVCTEH
ncbi:MAG: hypothetical protein ACAI35_06695 [Candidatus Methylacidiphilales bacterium]